MPAGDARIVVRASDWSPLGRLRGASEILSVPVTVDFEAPAVTPVTTTSMAERGGSAIVVYRVSPDAVRSGVEIGKRRFPGRTGTFADPTLAVEDRTVRARIGVGEDDELEADAVAGGAVAGGAHVLPLLAAELAEPARVAGAEHDLKPPTSFVDTHLGNQRADDAGAILGGLAQGGAAIGVPLTLTVHYLLGLRVAAQGAPKLLDESIAHGAFCCMAASCSLRDCRSSRLGPPEGEADFSAFSPLAKGLANP